MTTSPLQELVLDVLSESHDWSRNSFNIEVKAKYRVSRLNIEKALKELVDAERVKKSVEIRGDKEIVSYTLSDKPQPPTLNLYNLIQTENIGYGVYTSSIVCAPNAQEACTIHPLGDDLWGITKKWASSPENVTPVLIGIALPNVSEGTILAV